MAGTSSKSALSLVSQLPVARLKQEAQQLGQAVTKQGLSRASKGVESVTEKLNDYAQGGGSTAAKAVSNVAKGDSPAKAGLKATASKVKDTVKDKLGMGGGGGKGGKLKVTNILESIEVPVPRDVAYAQWTQFEDFPTFMKKVENVKQEEDEKLKWKAQIFWSHRSWEAEIVDQVPNERIVWKSDGEKGKVDGAITFHELAPDLTRILMTLEYHPKGLFEHTGNIWRAQGRRARLELKHFARHVSTQTLLHQDELEGWKGEIHDGEVTDAEAADRKEEEPEKKQGKGSEDRSEEKDEKSEDKSEEQPSRRRSRRTAKQSPSKRTAAAKKAPAKKASSTQSTSKRTAAAKKAPAKKTSSTQSTTKKTAAKKSAPAKKAPAKKTAAKKTAAKKSAPAKKAPAKKAPAKKTSPTAKKSSARKRTTKSSTR
jgi:uncharacterized membrane protein